MVPVLEGKDMVGVITATDIVKVVVLLGKIRGLFAEHEGKTRLVDLLSHRAHVRGHLLSHVAQTVEDIMTEEWNDPKVDIMKIKMRERYGIGILNEGKAIATLKNVHVVPNEIVLPATATIDVSGNIAAIPPTSNVLG